MKRSRERILTTHVGSLPRPADLADELMRPAKRDADPDFASKVDEAVRSVLRKQAHAGIDVVSDGEQGKAGFWVYVVDRLSGVSLRPMPTDVVAVPRDLQDHPDLLASSLRGVDEAAEEGAIREESVMFVNDGPVEYVGQDRLRTELKTLREALDTVDVEEAFVPCQSPFIATHMVLEHYGSRGELAEAMVAALAQEYREIVDAGFLIQLDIPDIVAKRVHPAVAKIEHPDEPDSDMSLDLWREHVAANVRYTNQALAGIDPDLVRVHVCWGNYPGPHHYDVPAREMIDLVYAINATGISIEGANPRHEHEWAMFEEFPLPPEKVVIPGVIDVCSPYIEHPELVSQRIRRYADVVGRERVIASTDCGFGTSAARSNIPESLVWAKLETLAEGARLASAALWSR